MVPMPISIPNTLAGNPPSRPQYATKIQLSSGEEAFFADPKATRAMIALMDMQAALGGAASHFGGPSAFAELMSALHGVVFQRWQPWYEYAHIINDAGHCENGIYALKANYSYGKISLESLKGFRSLQSPLAGHGEAHLFPEGVYLSNGPLGSSLPQAQGLCLADALSKKSRLTVVTVSDGACMEGEAKEALSAIPGWAQRGKMAPFVLVLSDNNTKLSGRIDEQSFSMAPSFNCLSEMGWTILKLERDQAHCLQSCVSIVERAFDLALSNPKSPVCIHAKTLKGYGVKAMEDSPSGGHGFPLKKPTELLSFLEEIYCGRIIPQEFIQWSKEMVEFQQSQRPQPSQPSQKEEHQEIPLEKVQVGISKAMIAARKKGWPLISVSSDLAGSTGVAPFQKEFPEATLDVGVAEANMISVGAGLSKAGFIPVVDTFAQFGVTKGALPLMMSSLSQAPVIAIFSHAGFQDAADGASHQALSYFSMTSSIPHTEVYSLATSAEAEALLTQAIEMFVSKRRAGQTPPSQIFFLGREAFPRHYAGTKGRGVSHAPETAEASGAADTAGTVGTTQAASVPETLYHLGKSQIVFDNSKDFFKSVTLVAVGPLLHQALVAADTLQKESIGAIVIQPSIINKPDMDNLLASLKKTAWRLITVEDHQVMGGLGAITAHALAQKGVKGFAMKSLGVGGQFGRSAYGAMDLYQKYGLDDSTIVEAAQAFFR